MIEQTTRPTNMPKQGKPILVRGIQCFAVSLILFGAHSMRAGHPTSEDDADGQDGTVAATQRATDRSKDDASKEMPPFRTPNPGIMDFMQGYGIKTGISATYTYDDNVYLSSGSGNGSVRGREGSSIFTVSPYFSITRGGAAGYEGGARNSLSLFYAPSFNLYDQDAGLDNVGHNFNLTADIELPKLSLTLSQQLYVFSEATFNNDGARAEREFYTGYLGANYPLSGKVSLSDNITYGTQLFQEGFNQYSVTDSGFINFQVMPKLTLGIGVLFGYLNIQDNSDQTYEQGLLNVTYNTFRKFTFNLTGGVEVRQLSGGEDVSFVFNGSVNYTPVDGTTVSLGAYRTNDSSSVIYSQAFLGNPVAGTFNENYTATGVSVSVSQRILQRATLTASFNYENSQYYSSQTGNDIGQNFNYFGAGVSLSVPITQWWSATAAYTFRHNASQTNSAAEPQNFFDFSDNQVSVSMTLSL